MENRLAAQEADVIGTYRALEDAFGSFKAEVGAETKKKIDVAIETFKNALREALVAASAVQYHELTFAIQSASFKWDPLPFGANMLDLTVYGNTPTAPWHNDEQALARHNALLLPSERLRAGKLVVDEIRERQREQHRQKLAAEEREQNAKPRTVPPPVLIQNEIPSRQVVLTNLGLQDVRRQAVATQIDHTRDVDQRYGHESTAN